MRFASIAFVLFLVTAAVLAAEPQQPLRSGLQPGEKIAAIFEPLNVTGPAAGEQHCLVCENGTNPVAMIFARTSSEPVLKLAAKIDAASARHRDQQLGSFIVFLSDAADLAAQLKQAGDKQKLQHLVLSIDAPAGPEGFDVSAEADVTVVLYREFDVAANHAFRKGELNEAAIEKILADVPKILKQK